MNFVELNKNETLTISGGGGVVPAFLVKVLKKSLFGAVALYIADNWSDVKKGVADGIADSKLP